MGETTLLGSVCTASAKQWFRHVFSFPTLSLSYPSTLLSRPPFLTLLLPLHVYFDSDLLLPRYLSPSSASNLLPLLQPSETSSDILLDDPLDALESFRQVVHAGPVAESNEVVTGTVEEVAAFGRVEIWVGC